MYFFRQFFERTIIDKNTVIDIGCHIVIRLVTERPTRLLEGRASHQNCLAACAGRLAKPLDLFRLPDMNKQNLIIALQKNFITAPNNSAAEGR